MDLIYKQALAVKANEWMDPSSTQKTTTLKNKRAGWKMA